MFFGYYLSAVTMVPDEHGPPVPELARRMTLTSCTLDPVRALAPVLTRMPEDGPGDIIDDSGYAHRDADAWAIPLRRTGAQLVQDLHPHDRGPRGTHHGAIIANGNLMAANTPGTAGTRAAAAQRRARRHRLARPADSRTRTAQARPAHQRRH